MILRVAERQCPPVAIFAAGSALTAVLAAAVVAVVKPTVHLCGRLPVIVQHHKQRVAPRPRVIILKQANGRQRRRVATVKIVRCHRGEKLVSRVLSVTPRLRGARPFAQS